MPPDFGGARPERSATTLHGREIRALAVKRALCYVVHLPLYAAVAFLLRCVLRLRIRDHEAIRAFYRGLPREGPPLLICANHLTIIDAALIIWALGSGPWYLQHFTRLPWNIPASDAFASRFVNRLIAALSKCIFIDRRGSDRQKDLVLRKCCYLLKAGDVFTIFPEGQRSRSGRFEVDHLRFGVGKIISLVGECRVLCLYLRADAQKRFSTLPPRSSVIDVSAELIHLRPQGRGRESYRTLTLQIGRSLATQEDRVFRREALSDLKRCAR